MTQECTIDKINEVLSKLQSELNGLHLSKKATANNNEQQSEKPIEEKRQSWWVRVRERVNKFCKAENQASDSGSSQGGSSGRKGQNNGKDQADADLEIMKLQSDIRQMKAAFENLTQFQSNMNKSLEFVRPKQLKPILEKTVSIRSRSQYLKDMRRKIFNLKCQIPSLLYKQSSRGLSFTDSQTAEEDGLISETGSDIYLPGLHVPDDFHYSPAFEEVMEKFEDLDFTHQQCLLSFAVFPENREVQRTMLMYWWIGEGFIECDNSEESVKTVLDKFSKRGLLEPVEDERKLVPTSYKMEPHVHSAVIFLAKFMELFDLYNSDGKLIMKKSEKKKVCLVRGSSLLRDAKTTVMEPKSLNSVFNSSERYPDFTFKWFPGMESLRVLYLGRWERTAKRHIEVESTEFLKNMKDLKDLKNLRLASFQGISRIEKLENSICALRRLVILDLKACYNLEVLPDDIGSLENLIYLDVSECYMLDRMPEGIADLLRLQVLKGFVISQSDDEKDCAVKHLKSLRKLSITVNRDVFKVENLMESLKGLERLESLKIAWGAPFPNKETTNEETQGGQATEEEHKDLKERGGDHVHNKGQTSEEKERDVEEKGKREAGEEGKKHRDEVKAESFKSGEVVEGEKKTSPSRESTKTDHQKEEGDGDKGKADQEEGKKQDEAEAEKSKSDYGVEGVKKASPSRESTEANQKKPDDKSKVEKEASGDKGKAADLEEGKKQGEVDAEKSKSDNGVEGVKKASPSQESTNAIQNKPDDHQKGDKQEEKGDGEKEKVDLVEGNKKDEVKAESSKPDKVIEGDEKTIPPQESKDTVKSKPDDHRRGDKQEGKGDEEKENVNLEEGKKKDEVKSDTSKPDKAIEGDEKTIPQEESKDMIQSKPDDNKENSKVQEKGDGEKKKSALKKFDGGEAKTQKPDNKSKFGKKVSFSEEPIQKKPNDRKMDNAMAKETHETSSPSIPKKTSPKAEPPVTKRSETKRWGKKKQEDSTIDTSKLPSSLRKLELECFPDKDPPSWLNPKNLDQIEKLAIKGGSLSRISDELPTAEKNSCIRILRLKYLHEFKAEWKDLQALFPNIQLLEKYKCPKVAFCPTDGNGVWRSQPQAKDQEAESAA